MSHNPRSLYDVVSDAPRRPVFTKDQLTALSQRIIHFTTADVVSVSVTHTARVVSRMANGRVLTNDDGDELDILVCTMFGEKGMVQIRVNQLDDTMLRAAVTRAEAIARMVTGYSEPVKPIQRTVQDSYVPVHLWHDDTIDAMTTTRETVIPELLETVSRAGLNAAGFLGFMARSEAALTKEGIFAFNEETDCELTITARSDDNRSSGWGGQAARSWSQIQPAAVAARAIEMAHRSANPVAVEPGRRTAILSPEAVVQLLRFLSGEFNAFPTDQGGTAFSRHPRGNKLGQHVFDSRLKMGSDPADPDGGYRPYFGSYSQLGLGNPAMTWIEGGVLKNLAYDVGWAMVKGKTYADIPSSFRLSGGTTTVDEMIAQCREGIYVNRFSGVELLDLSTGLSTGVTRDGCFLVKDGKISKSVKNFRFLESPFFFLNRIEALGVPVRATFGYTPPAPTNDGAATWPRPPIIVPPMMVRDFNFCSLADAV